MLVSEYLKLQRSIKQLTMKLEMGPLRALWLAKQCQSKRQAKQCPTDEVDAAIVAEQQLASDYRKRFDQLLRDARETETQLHRALSSIATAIKQETKLLHAHESYSGMSQFYPRPQCDPPKVVVVLVALREEASFSRKEIEQAIEHFEADYNKKSEETNRLLQTSIVRSRKEAVKGTIAFG